MAFSNSSSGPQSGRSRGHLSSSQNASAPPPLISLSSAESEDEEIPRPACHDQWEEDLRLKEEVLEMDERASEARHKEREIAGKFELIEKMFKEAETEPPQEKKVDKEEEEEIQRSLAEWSRKLDGTWRAGYKSREQEYANIGKIVDPADYEKNFQHFDQFKSILLDKINGRNKNSSDLKSAALLLKDLESVLQNLDDSWGNAMGNPFEVDNLKFCEMLEMLKGASVSEENLNSGMNGLREIGCGDGIGMGKHEMTTLQRNNFGGLECNKSQKLSSVCSRLMTEFQKPRWSSYSKGIQVEHLNLLMNQAIMCRTARKGFVVKISSELGTTEEKTAEDPISIGLGIGATAEEAFIMALFSAYNTLWSMLRSSRQAGSSITSSVACGNL